MMTPFFNFARVTVWPTRSQLPVPLTIALFFLPYVPALSPTPKISPTDPPSFRAQVLISLSLFPPNFRGVLILYSTQRRRALLGPVPLAGIERVCFMDDDSRRPIDGLISWEISTSCRRFADLRPVELVPPTSPRIFGTNLNSHLRRVAFFSCRGGSMGQSLITTRPACFSRLV